MKSSKLKKLSAKEYEAHLEHQRKLYAPIKTTDGKNTSGPVEWEDEVKTHKKIYRYTGFGNPYDRLVRLANDNKEFYHTHTTATTRLLIDEYASYSSYMYGGRDYSFKEFHLQRKLKNEIRTNIKEKKIKVPKFTQADINYFTYSPKLIDMEPGEYIDEITSFDINKAYYTCAYHLGYMNKEMYEECIHLPKHIRLRFIGTIATCKTTYHRVGWRMASPVKIERDKLLRRVWFHICKEVDNCLRDFMEILGDNFLLYYVDGIYMKKGDYSDQIKYISGKYGFEFKQEEVSKIVRMHRETYDSQGIDIYKWDERKKKFLPKEFTFRKTNPHENDNMKQLLAQYGFSDKVSNKQVNKFLSE